ncbi:hypothetical protein Tco_1567576 [Tanacetum coccineum]
MEIQAGWSKGLSIGRSDHEILILTKIAKGYRHSVADLMKVIPDLAPIDTTSVPSNSAALADLVDPLAQKVT